MPYARNRKNLALNRVYAYVLSSRFGEATDCIVKKLENKGFSDKEAQSAVERIPANDFFSSNLQSNKIIKEKIYEKQFNL